MCLRIDVYTILFIICMICFFLDCTAPIIEKYFEGDSLWIRVQVPHELIKYIVPKGFISVDGTSLTICDVDTLKSTFTFMLISHTQQSVIIPRKEVGDLVNIEVDVLAKMVSQSLGGIYERLDRMEKMLQDK